MAQVVNRTMLIGAACVFVVAAIVASDVSGAIRLVAVLIVLLPLALYLAVRTPRLAYCALALELGAIPFADVPGVNFPLAPLLTVLVVVTAIIQLPKSNRRFSGLEWWCVALIVASTVSMIATFTSIYDIQAYGEWLIATGLLFALRRLLPDDLRAFGRWFVYGAAGAGVFGAALLVLDPGGRILNALSVIGYGSVNNLRYVFSDSGVSTVRLTGTFIDPNAGGLFLATAFFLCIALFRGAARIGLAAVLLGALALTLSRENIASLGVGVLVFVAFRNISFGGKVRGIGIVAALAAVALAVPSIQDRLLAALDPNDVGAQARTSALQQFPYQVSGHWLWGLGWGRIEFRDAAIGEEVNYVSNSPLLTVYRGGLIVGAIFTIILIIGIVRSLRGLRQQSSEYAIVGAGFCGIALVAFQLDFPVVTIYPTTMVFSVLLAFLPEVSRRAVAEQVPGLVRPELVRPELAEPELTEPELTELGA